MNIKTEVQDSINEDNDSMNALENDLIEDDEAWPNFDTFNENDEQYYGYDGAEFGEQEDDYANFDEKPLNSSGKIKRKRKSKKADGTISSKKVCID